MTHVFPYLVTHLGKEQFERTLSEEVFPNLQIWRRNVVGTRHELRELGTHNDRTEYLWLIDTEFTGGSETGPPTLSDLQQAVGSFGAVTEPFASVTVDFDLSYPDRGRAKIRPSLVKVNVGGPMFWSFIGMPLGYKPCVDFVGFKTDGGDFTESFESPFEELTVGSRLVTGARARGPIGTYWYEVSLVPDRGTGKEIIRLECDRQTWHRGRHGAGVEISDPPVRG